jgi:hypothetical protein
MFILCALEFQNTKAKILETHHGDKPHNTKILEPCSHEIEFQQHITNYKRITNLQQIPNNSPIKQKNQTSTKRTP